MNHVVPAVTGFCLLLGACSGGSVESDGAMPPVGSAGSGAMANVGGTSAMGGAPGSSGATTTAGTSATAGTTSGGGTSATGGTSAMGGQGATTAMGGAGPMGGSGGSGGTSAMGGNGGLGSQAGSSATGIDFSIWSLQLPIGSGTSPTTISPSKLAAGYTSDYFYIAPDGGQAFMDPQTGITTSGSQHCRTEMREDKTDGSQAGWASSGTNTMTVSGAVLQVGGGSGGDVTVAQVFNGSDSIPLCELQYSNGAHGFKMFYEEAKGSGGSPIDLKTPVALNAKYTFTLSLTKGVLTATINGAQVYTHTPSSGILAKSFYFKFGNYDQTTSAGGISTTAYTVVEAYAVDVVHK